LACSIMRKWRRKFRQSALLVSGLATLAAVAMAQPQSSIRVQERTMREMPTGVSDSSDSGTEEKRGDDPKSPPIGTQQGRPPISKEVQRNQPPMLQQGRILNDQPPIGTQHCLGRPVC
jgi:hypothetical protein